MKRVGYGIFIAIACIAVCICGQHLFADQIPGSQYYYLGNGISFFPLGASGVSYFMTMDANLYNPAGFADTKRVTTDISLGGFSGDNFLLNARGSFPTNFGVLTGNVLALTSPGGTTAGNIYGFKGTFSKFISEEWLFGGAINLGFANGPESDFYTSLDLGTIYRKSVDGIGFGFFDHSVGFAIRNLGKNISYSGYDGFPPLEVDLGFNAEFIRAGIYKSRLSSHFAVPFNPFNTFFGVGLENIFLDMVNIKLGLNFGIEDISPYSLGFDLNFDLQDTDIQLSYSLLPTDFNGNKQFTHYAGISVAFGNYDKKPPKASVEAADMYFSPNHDGVYDRAKFDMEITDNTMVFGWKLEITDESGKPVKAFMAEDVRKIRHMTIGKYAKRIFAKKEEVKIPKLIEWDGEDVDGVIVEDGDYYYTLTAWDENNNQTVTERGKLIVDTLIPLVEAKAEMDLFSPNEDGVKDTLLFRIQSANIEKSDETIIQILNKDGNAVFEQSYTGSVPDEFVWDGRNSSGALVQEGLYRFRISSEDFSGNSTTSTVEGIQVRTEYEKVSVSPTFRAFSPNNDGYFDINEIKLFSSSKEGLLEWTLDIIDRDEVTIRSFSGQRDFPEVIVFDGKNEDGRPLSDGMYTLRFRLFFESGNHPESYYKFVRIDNTPPEIEVSSNINAFSPNGDGVKDTVNFTHRITSGEGDDFLARIMNSSGAVFKTFQYGKNPPDVVVWDGMGDDNTQPVEGMYTYTITGKDEVANETTRMIGPIKLVTGFEQVSVEPSEYVISPNGDGRKDTVEFKLNTNNLQGIVEWKMDIKDSSDQVVRSYSDREMGLTLPPEIQWKGMNEAGTVVEDGVYSAVFSILYDTGNNPISKPKDIKIDTDSPEIEIYVEDLHISPNDDGAKETITIYQRISGEEDDEFQAVIQNQDDAVVREFRWKGSIPAEIVWDGRDNEGDALPEGYYSYTITGKDAAGNMDEQTIAGIVLTTVYEEVNLVANQEAISPNGDGYLDVVEFVPSITSEEGLKNWYLDIYNSQGQRVKAFEGMEAPPTLLRWDAMDESGELVPDGTYYYSIGVLYSSGNHPSSETGKVIVDRTPPEYHFVVSPTLFSPDGDGEADTMYINLALYDKSGVSDWQVSIYRKWDEKVDRSVVFKTFSGSGTYKGTIKWDGYSDPISMPSHFSPPDEYTYKKVDEKWAVLVDSASSYVAELRTGDVYRNTLTEVREFNTDILVITTPFGLKIMINSIQFEFDRADLLPQSYSILDRLIQILDKFPNYKIRIVGHTDWVGTDEYNQKLSEKRAFSVYKYLVEHDVDKDRLSTEGLGETQPIDDNNTESGRARNRRVEFYLTKKS
jgi:outer membrane protein OmpA-like peptidoglycan-associated protein/flagellar hook assembly protein FlgD